MDNHHFSMGKSTISMIIFNSYVTNYQRVVVYHTKMGNQPLDRPLRHLCQEHLGSVQVRPSSVWRRGLVFLKQHTSIDILIPPAKSNDFMNTKTLNRQKYVLFYHQRPAFCRNVAPRAEFEAKHSGQQQTRYSFSWICIPIGMRKTMQTFFCLSPVIHRTYRPSYLWVLSQLIVGMHIAGSTFWLLEF